MGQTVRQRKYNLFWRWCSNEEMYEDAIEMLLATLTDDQLDELLIEISNRGGLDFNS